MYIDPSYFRCLSDGKQSDRRIAHYSTTLTTLFHCSKDSETHLPPKRAERLSTAVAGAHPLAPLRVGGEATKTE